jgi:hypothetical protein
MNSLIRLGLRILSIVVPKVRKGPVVPKVVPPPPRAKNQN